MSIVQKFKSFWFGPADNYEQEDFEDLFETADDVYATNGQLALDRAPVEMPAGPSASLGASIGVRNESKVVLNPSAAT
ncbi:MAG: hypothetical protein KC777_06280, partial [Cyanobacteria bacterium HKST-UBA02]|nr:hypothetical protein [Cyanobacteria bacterium HKST-UBA02]